MLDYRTGVVRGGDYTLRKTTDSRSVIVCDCVWGDLRVFVCVDPFLECGR